MSGQKKKTSRDLLCRGNSKQLLDEVFVISGIIKVEVSVISRSRRLRLITLTETLIIPDITKTESNNCFIIHCFEEKTYLLTYFLTSYFLTSLSANLTLGSLSSDVFERRTSTGNKRFALLRRDFEQIFGQIVSIRIKTLGNINTVASRHIKRAKGSLLVDVCRSKTSLLKLPNAVRALDIALGNHALLAQPTDYSLICRYR